MKPSSHFPALLVIILAILSSTIKAIPSQLAVGPRSLEFRSPQPSFYIRQLELLKLFNNLNCWRDEDVQKLSNTFNPLENLQLYKNPELVRTYFGGLQSGQGLRRDEPFVNNQNTIAELKTVFLIHFLIDDWNLFYMTAAYSLARVNSGMFYWALSTLVSSKYDHEHFRTPPSYEVFPQLFTPKRILYSLNGLQEIHTNLTNGVEQKLDYYRHDPQVNSFHLAWHVDFPFWWKQEDYNILKDRKGEMFLYMHRQMLNRYRCERISVGGLEDFTPLKLDEEIGAGYVASSLNINFKEFPPRLNNSRLLDLPNLTVKTMQTLEDNFWNGVTKGYLITDDGKHVLLDNNTGYDVVGATAEASESSASQNIYGSLHNRLHRMIARIPDPDQSLMLLPGAIAHSETAVTDPVFFRIHSLIDKFYTQQSRNVKPYTDADLKLHGVDLIVARVMKEEETSPPVALWPFEPPPSVLETFFEDFSFDVANGIESCDRLDKQEKFVATIKRWNHKPFKYYLKVNSHKHGNVNTTVRIYMSPVVGYDGKPYTEEKLYANMFEMDRFTVTLSKGNNVITRSSKDSAVTVPDATPTEQLLRETRAALDKGIENPERPKGFKFDRHCGYPHHMLVPKGTQQGMKFKMFFILTEGEELLNFPGVPVCGVATGEYPDRKPMGFPFDRKVTFGLTMPWFVHQNYKFLDVIVRHKG